MQLIPPDLLAWWTKLLREASNLSQEALAASSDLTTRTIQRIEAGEPSSVTTRRALSRGLGYDNPSTFDDPTVVQSLTAIRAEIGRIGKDALDAQFPDRVRLPATRVTTGEQLGRLAENSNANAFHWDEDLSGEAKAAAAAIFDYLRDYADADDLYSATQRLDVYDQLEELLHELHATGAAAHSALRMTSIVGDSWKDKTPMRVCIAYLVVNKSDKEIREILATKRFQTS